MWENICTLYIEVYFYDSSALNIIYIVNFVHYHYSKHFAFPQTNIIGIPQVNCIMI